MSDLSSGASRGLFPDDDLVAYVTEVYGPVMGAKCEDIFNDDPENQSGFAASIRRSLTRELDSLIRHGIYEDVMSHD